MQSGIELAVDVMMDAVYELLDEFNNKDKTSIEDLYFQKGKCKTGRALVLMQLKDTKVVEAKRMVLAALVDNQNRCNGALVDKIFGGVTNAE